MYYHVKCFVFSLFHRRPPLPHLFLPFFLNLFFAVESFGHWFFSCCVRVMRTVNDFPFVFVFMILPPPCPLLVNLVCHAVVRYRCHLGEFFFFLHFLSFFYSLLLWNINHYTCSSSACYNAFFFQLAPSPPPPTTIRCLLPLYSFFFHYPWSTIHDPLSGRPLHTHNFSYMFYGLLLFFFHYSFFILLH